MNQYTREKQSSEEESEKIRLTGRLPVYTSLILLDLALEKLRQSIRDSSTDTTILRSIQKCLELSQESLEEL